MRTNGFALFRGPDSRASAEKAVRTVQRHCKEIVVTAVSQLEGLDMDGGWVVACELEGRRSLPIVHGFLEDEIGAKAEPSGEYALLSERTGSLVASRDSLGT